MIYIPDDATLLYQMFEFYHPDHSRGLRWNDPYFNIQWPPEKDRIISDRDRTYGDFIL